jgi:hypothetical protein
MFHTYIVSFLSGCCICFAMTFSSVLRCFCKCFRCMFEVFHLSSNVCCKYIYWMFQKHMLQWCRWLDGRPTAGLQLLPRTAGLALSSPLPPLPFLLFPFLPFPSLHLAAIVRARCRRGVRQRWSGMGREAGPWCQGQMYIQAIGGAGAGAGMAMGRIRIGWGLCAPEPGTRNPKTKPQITPNTDSDDNPSSKPIPRIPRTEWISETPLCMAT